MQRTAALEELRAGSVATDADAEEEPDGNDEADAEAEDRPVLSKRRKKYPQSQKRKDVSIGFKLDAFHE